MLRWRMSFALIFSIVLTISSAPVFLVLKPSGVRASNSAASNKSKNGWANKLIGNWLHSMVYDCGYGLRQFRKNPSFATVAVLTLAIAIGANTAVFSVVNAVLLRPLRYPDSDRLVQIWSTNPGAN